ncbi:MAG TPA: ArsR family transcriptional regulator [Candidatus Aerophobetes bacterium]|uniref:ArsR family transcriptional regulator n=1 Tax=Aerophobetes bacterium TaxID=2030807 RepID=A0A7V5M0K6_UNCAE|nr:ArsR family transcriptional regulator [Candidatus Aerophobetes bacterium]
MPDEKKETLIKLCKALSDPTRLKIFLFLTERSLCVKAIVKFLGVSQPAVSQHLRILKEAGLVKADKRGYWMHYSANLKKLRELMDIILEITGREENKKEKHDLLKKELQNE